MTGRSLDVLFFFGLEFGGMCCELCYFSLLIRTVGLEYEWSGLRPRFLTCIEFLMKESWIIITWVVVVVHWVLKSMTICVFNCLFSIPTIILKVIWDTWLLAHVQNLRNESSIENSSFSSSFTLLHKDILQLNTQEASQFNITSNTIRHIQNAS